MCVHIVKHCSLLCVCVDILPHSFSFSLARVLSQRHISVIDHHSKLLSRCNIFIPVYYYDVVQFIISTEVDITSNIIRMYVHV